MCYIFRRKVVEQDIYINHTFDILPEGFNNLHAGDHKFSFKYTLPYNLPQTTNQKKLDVETIFYYCAAILSTGSILDSKCRTDFILKRRDYSNRFPILRQPVIKEYQKNFYGIFGKRGGPILMKVMLPYAGITVGETIQLKIQYDNQSKLEISQTKIELVESIIKSYKGDEVCFCEKSFVVDYIDGIGINDFKELKYNFKVPDDIHNSDLLYTNYMKTKHSIQIQGIVKNMHFNPRVFIPIVIGSDRCEEERLYELGAVNEKENLIITDHLSKTRFYSKLGHYIK
ncbi:hypothetical protein PVAND_005221 [Polypedilum vanderplanki]|uniref:Arrestin C-terminal-like domain-containing protein n=1 Tax=Polypedilum vanderplanki TaxID=319348 RepID=A0A9J6C1E9_POLVA|nr:hypothetical protein PVAND_005221 [Polypedilum vanderplanki]